MRVLVHLLPARMAIACLIMLSSCTEKIQVELVDTGPRVVIEAMLINATQIMEVYLHYSSPYFSNKAPRAITGARVFLDDGSVVTGFHEADTGLYRSNTIVDGIPGVNYTLAVEHEGEVYTASSVMPAKPAIDSLKAYFRGPEHWKNVSIGLYAKEDPLPGNYYLFRAYVNNILDTDTITEAVITSDKLYNGNNFNGVIVQEVRAAESDRVTLVMAAITKEYYNFLYAFFRETRYNNGPFEAAPAPITGNFSNGALGFFSTQSRDLRSIVISRID